MKNLKRVLIDISEHEDKAALFPQNATGFRRSGTAINL
jgi:hypothetical protein